MPACITSIRRMYRYDCCEKVIFAETWLTRRRWNPRWLTRPRRLSTGTYWRNAWKYQARTYRHFGWDNGTLLANMLAVAGASGLPAEIVLGFVDDEVNRLLDLDTRREVSLCLVPIARTSERSLPEPKEAPALGLETIPLSQREIEYPAMLEMHDASSLASIEEVAQWRRKPTVLPCSPLAGE